jgi:hypothetical protein
MASRAFEFPHSPSEGWQRRERVGSVYLLEIHIKSNSYNKKRTLDGNGLN